MPRQFDSGASFSPESPSRHDASARERRRGAPACDPPKILIATIQRLQGETGLETFVGHFDRFLTEGGHPPTVVTPLSGASPLALAVLASRRLIDPLSGSLSVWWFRHFREALLRAALARLLEGGKPCVIYAMCPVSAQAAMRARRDPRQKVVMSVRFNRSQAEEWQVAGKIRQGGRVYDGIRRLEAELLPKLDGLHFVSRFMRDHTYAHHPATANCASILLPNFVADPGSPAGSGREPEGDLISIGTLEPRKNQGYLIRVLHEARKLGHEYSLTLIGRGPDRPRLQRLARELGVHDRVRFAGFVPDAARLLPRYRAYAHSALVENLPFVLVEAAACGLPTLAPATGGMPEVFADGEQGFYWPLDDPQAGARKLIALLEDADTYARLARGARRKFETDYSLDLLAPRLRDFLLAVADKTPSPPV